MKFLAATAALVAGATLAHAGPATPEAANQWRRCTARVLYSEELPFAPEGTWLVKETLEITPPNGPAYVMTLQDWIRWQAPPPRRGETLRLLCNLAYPGELHLLPRSPGRSAL